MTEENILTAKEVSKYLKVPLSSLHLLARTKKIPAFKVGKHWRFNKATIEEWMSKQQEHTK